MGPDPESHKPAKQLAKHVSSRHRQRGVPAARMVHAASKTEARTDNIALGMCLQHNCWNSLAIRITCKAHAIAA